MEHTDTILGQIEPDITQRLVTRREAIMRGAAVGSTVAAGLAMASAPIAFAALSREAFGQSTPASVQAVINFALMLEIFENEFYKAVLGTSSLAAQNAAFAPVRATVPASALPAIQQIQKHETEHVAFLGANGAVNTLNLTAASFDFTGARGAGNGPFARATTELAFLLLTAQGAEDTGVRAYKGQAGNLQSNPAVLEAALRIHSVEARHASKIRRLRRATGATTVKFSGTITGGADAAGAGNISSPPAGAVAALGLIYAGEDNVTQGGVDVTTLPNMPSGINVSAAATEAFDEPLTMAQVVAIVQPFFIPSLS
jgi:ferritin-like protein